MVDLYEPQDVTKKYPQPPFKPQQQPVPGTIFQMDPPADHGEESYKGSGRLAGRKALITGGDSGIGRAVAIAFGREGADVALNYLPEEQKDAEDTAKYAGDGGAKVELIPGDLADEAFNAELVEKTVAALGGLDLLVMIGGRMPTVSGIEDFDTEVFDNLLKVNVHSLFWLTKAAKRHLKPGASIITTSSIQGFVPSPTLVEYAVTKAGIANWTRAMAQQLAEDGIRVNGVAPGPFWTPLQPSSVPNEKIEEFGAEAAYGRPGQPVELSSTYVYLASQDSSYTSGETIAVTGGTPTH
ncbi:SDR family oxidoreductase [Amnibacterium flavum]|uniref:NAD(P)-dependent dehydrogenase n=1 Tax=Amnibacterium flavum TaxID=2173173 RepID=A0A2V1HW30_9MICO|nr:SDR family oxidoreductase [Amnibacterium flavum]PVZ95290.1 NAD(P)-dependent dehydrogenase [Amnibacterium flavum]